MEQKNKSIYDIAVVGAGPAGAVFVKELAEARPDLKIALIDGQSRIPPSRAAVFSRLTRKNF